jgi:NADH-quinone oxidoreductase subunit C
MKTSEEIYQILKDKFQDKIVEFKNIQFEPHIIVDAKAVKDIGLFLRDEDGLEFDSLMCLSGVDDANGEKKKEEDGTITIVGGTISVYYHLHSIIQNLKLTLKVSTSRENPEVESVESVWKTADWHEREAYDMFGILFLNHPDLRRILMPYDWEAGYPLRKDYKNPEFYKGMKVPY